MTFEDDEFDMDIPEHYKGRHITLIAWQPLPEPYKEESK